MTLRPTILVLAMGLASFLPFISKPLFVDDHAIYLQAIDLAKQPGIPYSMTPGKLGWEKGQSVGEDNPPVYFYLLAALIHCFGEESWKLRLGILPIQLAGLLAFYFIACRTLRHPLWATGILICTPHVWVTSNSLLVDSILGYSLLIGLAVWIRAWETRQLRWAIAAGFFFALTPLIKYTGILVWPLAILYPWMSQPPSRRWKGWLVWVIPITLFSAWLLYSKHVYGTDHFSAVATTRMTLPGIQQLTTLTAFVSGTTPLLLIWLSRRQALWRCGIAILFGLASVLAYPDPLTGWIIGFWVSVCLLWLLDILPTVQQNWATRWWMIWWVCGLGGLSIALGWVCARFLVIVTPAIILLSIYRLEQEASGWMNHRPYRLVIGTGLGVIGLLFVHADFTQARVDQQAAVWAQQQKTIRQISGIGYYPSASLGGISVFLPPHEWHGIAAGHPLPAGSLVLLPTYTLSRHFFPTADRIVYLDQLTIRSWNPLRVIHNRQGVGFYGSIWGVLPFGWTREPVEVYRLFRVEK